MCNRSSVIILLWYLKIMSVIQYFHLKYDQANMMQIFGYKFTLSWELIYLKQRLCLCLYETWFSSEISALSQVYSVAYLGPFQTFMMEHVSSMVPLLRENVGMICKIMVLLLCENIDLICKKICKSAVVIQSKLSDLKAKASSSKKPIK